MAGKQTILNLYILQLLLGLQKQKELKYEGVEYVLVTSQKLPHG